MATMQTEEECGEYLRVYFSNLYKRWTVDVTKPRHVERKTFPSKDKADLFAMAKRSELMASSPLASTLNEEKSADV